MKAVTFFFFSIKRNPDIQYFIEVPAYQTSHFLHFHLDVKPIKVNDKIGNPILIGLTLVWKLEDSYKAMFEIDVRTIADNKTSQMGVAVAGRLKKPRNAEKQSGLPDS